MLNKISVIMAGLMMIITHPAESQVSHEAWNMFLKTHVTSSGNVNYKNILKDKKTLDVYLKYLTDNPPKNNWSVNERKGYWINAYNAFTIKLIIQNYPVKSIKDIGGIFKSPWDIDFITIDGEAYTLNRIEHEILRKEFADPRIHFAIVCASRSCPDLRNEAYDALRLDQQLDEAASVFVTNLSKNRIASDKIEISKIFDWFEKDFTANGSVIDFLNKYSRVRIDRSASVSYSSYDWNLNE
jgi:hypothetical protein